MKLSKFAKLNILNMVMMVAFFLVVFVIASIRQPYVSGEKMYTDFFSIIYAHFVILPVYLVVLSKNNKKLDSIYYNIRFSSPVNIFLHRLYKLILEVLLFSCLYFITGMIFFSVFVNEVFSMVTLFVWVVQFLMFVAFFSLVGAIFVVLSFVLNDLVSFVVIYIAATVDVFLSMRVMNMGIHSPYMMFNVADYAVFGQDISPHTVYVLILLGISLIVCFAGALLIKRRGLKIV